MAVLHGLFVGDAALEPTQTPTKAVAQYEYNEIGQIVDKKLHGTGTPGSETFLQSIDYRYTIQGWLKSINNSQLTSDAGVTNDEANDYFGLELAYNKSVSGLTNGLYYNGQVSVMKWKQQGTGTTSAGQRSYRYNYDKNGKLKGATFQAYGTSAWDKETHAQDEWMAHDQGGNIKTLGRHQRNHYISGTSVSYVSQQIDTLTYTYDGTNGNSLTKVTDGASLAAGFDNGTSGTSTDYTYDASGNATKDANKGINTITYTLLGKPAVITYADGRHVDYTYDGAGNKLTMKTYNSSNVLQTTTDYVGGFVYTNGMLSFFGSPEGRVLYNSGTFERQYSIADNQGNTRVVFSSVTPVATAPVATFEGDANDHSSEYLNVTNIVSFASANHTASGSKVIRMNQNNKSGPAKTLHVYPGDAVDMEVWTYYESSSGYLTSNATLGAMITQVAAAFGGVSGGGGESGAIYNRVNAAMSAFGDGANQGDTRPAAFLNYIQFDKNYNTLDAGWVVVPASANFSKQLISIPTRNIKEEGYMYIYLSYENLSNNYVYFDDFKVTHTKTNVIQYNEYYPFGLQASNSWTRENSSNNFLYNEASELNATTGFYDLPFRNYDAALGRFFQIDPLAHMDASTSPFVYGGNNPVAFNDPSGALMYGGEVGRYTPGIQGNYDDGWTGWSTDYGGAGGPGGQTTDNFGGAGGHYIRDAGGVHYVDEFGLIYNKVNVYNDFYILREDGWEFVDSEFKYSFWNSTNQYEVQTSSTCGPGPFCWERLRDSWNWHVVQPIIDAFTINSPLLKRGAGFMIIGKNGQKVQINFAQKNAGNRVVGILDLNDPNNVLSVLSMLTANDELAATTSALEIHLADPRNQYDKFGNLIYIPIKGIDGYYQKNHYDTNPYAIFKYQFVKGHHIMYSVDFDEVPWNYFRLHPDWNKK